MSGQHNAIRYNILYLIALDYVIYIYIYIYYLVEVWKCRFALNGAIKGLGSPYIFSSLNLHPDFVIYVCVPLHNQHIWGEGW